MIAPYSSLQIVKDAITSFECILTRGDGGKVIKEERETITALFRIKMVDDRTAQIHAYKLVLVHPRSLCMAAHLNCHLVRHSDDINQTPMPLVYQCTTQAEQAADGVRGLVQVDQPAHFDGEPRRMQESRTTNAEEQTDGAKLRDRRRAELEKKIYDWNDGNSGHMPTVESQRSTTQSRASDDFHLGGEIDRPDEAARPRMVELARSTAKSHYQQ